MINSDLCKVINGITKENVSEYLAEAFSLPNISTIHNIESTQHFKYLKEYLFLDEDGLLAKTIVIEKYYVSLTYLGDYLNYYSQCYFDYEKRCRRVHFFSNEFNESDFFKMITTNQLEENWGSYLGNVVIKPLPRGIIGASLLSPYLKKKQNRYYTAVKNYEINLFGRGLNIKTLAYQEQDGIVGSCASSALWFAFQKTTELFSSKSLTPSDITISAGYDSFYTGKIFPSDSLDINQICRAVFSSGLISEVRESKVYMMDKKWLKGILYAYSRMGIPVLLGISIEKRGDHLVTITGFRYSDEQIDEPSDKIKIKLISDNISKFYVHDDQCGPFARLEFIDKVESSFTFKTSWWENIDYEEELMADAKCAVIPLKDNIRVTYENILDEVKLISYIFDVFCNLRFEWDIYLCESNKYKVNLREDIFDNPDFNEENAKEILFVSLPQYIWVAQAKLYGDDVYFLVFDLLYDAIDINYKNSPYFVNSYNSEFLYHIENHDLIKIFPFFKDKLYKNRQRSEELHVLLGDAADDRLRKIKNIVEELREENPDISFEKIIEHIKSIFSKRLKITYEAQNKELEKKSLFQ